jgi:hypothetical protein
MPCSCVFRLEMVGMVRWDLRRLVDAPFQRLCDLVQPQLFQVTVYSVSLEPCCHRYPADVALWETRCVAQTLIGDCSHLFLSRTRAPLAVRPVCGPAISAIRVYAGASTLVVHVGDDGRTRDQLRGRRVQGRQV